MLSSLAGMLCVLLVVDGDALPIHICCDEEAGKGLLPRNEAATKVFGVTVDHVQYLPRGILGNVDGVSCMYSTEQSVIFVNEEI